MAAGRDGAPARSGRADRLGRKLGDSSPDHTPTNNVIHHKRIDMSWEGQAVTRLEFDGGRTWHHSVPRRTVRPMLENDLSDTVCELRRSRCGLGLVRVHHVAHSGAGLASVLLPAGWPARDFPRVHPGDSEPSSAFGPDGGAVVGAIKSARASRSSSGRRISNTPFIEQQDQWSRRSLADSVACSGVSPPPFQARLR
jgi:hypothetical protein